MRNNKSILFISPYLPSENSGHAGAQLIFRNIIALSNNYNIILLTFVNESEIQDIIHLEKNNIKVHYIILNRNAKSNLKKIFNLFFYLPEILKSIFMFQPFFVLKYKNKKMIRKLSSIIKSHDIDVVQIEYNIMHHYLDYIKTIRNFKSVLMLHDVSTKVAYRSLKEEKNYFFKITKFLQFLKWKNLEPKILKKFDDVVVLTKEDKVYIENWKIKKIHIIPPQLQLKSISFELQKDFELIFIGSYNREPNIQALNILLNEIFPKLQTQFPELKLNIIGKFLSNSIINKINQNSNISYLGFVKNIDEEIAKSMLMIAPIYIGAGLKMKIPHVLSCGVPVVTTSIGAEGIDLTANDGLFISDNIDDIINISQNLLNKKIRLIELGDIAKESVTKLFNSEKIVNQLTSIYN